MHIGSGLNTVSSLYSKRKSNYMKTPASGEKTFYAAETPKVYQIFETDNMLWTGGNGTGLSYCLKYADDSKCVHWRRITKWRSREVSRLYRLKLVIWDLTTEEILSQCSKKA